MVEPVITIPHPFISACIALVLVQVIKYQHDHVLLLESMLYYNLPPFVGNFAKTHVLPAFGVPSCGLAVLRNMR